MKQAELKWCLVAAVVVLTAAGCARGPREVMTSPFGPKAPLKKVAKNYERGCVCGTRLSNNCAHYLANAFILAGYDELLKDPEIGERCPAGRPIRAQDMMHWFQRKAKRFQQGKLERGTGLWATYQEKPNRRHVLISDSDSQRYYGTDNCLSWPVQWHYQW